VACSVAISLRSLLKASKHDPDLIRQRQTWSGICHGLFLAAFVAGILSITLNARGPAYMMSNWFLASAKDANIFTDSNSALAPFQASAPAPFPAFTPVQPQA